MFIISDHLGSTSLVTDSSGVVINETKYKACPLRFHYGMLREGETRYTSGSEQTKYGYTGQYSYVSDPSTGSGHGFGLHFYNARWYDSSLSRFAQADTILPNISNSQAWDRYAYVNNAPLKYIDPSGNVPHDCFDGGDYCKGTNSTSIPLGKICGSNGGFGPGQTGPNCSGEDQNTSHLTSVDNNTFPGYEITPSIYPGYCVDSSSPCTEGDPYTNPYIGKSRQTQEVDNFYRNQPYVVLVGYSSGVHTALFVAELRDSRGQRTDLILIGPPFQTDPLFPVLGIDTALQTMDEAQFVSRVQVLTSTTSSGGVHIFMVDESKHSNYQQSFGNFNSSQLTYWGYPYSDDHIAIDDIDFVMEKAYEWLTSGNYSVSLP